MNTLYFWGCMIYVYLIFAALYIISRWCENKSKVFNCISKEYEAKGEFHILSICLEIIAILELLITPFLLLKDITCTLLEFLIYCCFTRLLAYSLLVLFIFKHIKINKDCNAVCFKSVIIALALCLIPIAFCMPKDAHIVEEKTELYDITEIKNDLVMYENRKIFNTFFLDSKNDIKTTQDGKNRIMIKTTVYRVECIIPFEFKDCHKSLSLNKDTYKNFMASQGVIYDENM